MQLLFLGQWEGHLDWKLLLAERTLHYSFFFLLFFFYIASSSVLSVLFLFFFYVFFLLCSNYNYKLGLSTIYVQYITCTLFNFMKKNYETVGPFVIM